MSSSGVTRRQWSLVGTIIRAPAPISGEEKVSFSLANLHNTPSSLYLQLLDRPLIVWGASVTPPIRALASDTSNLEVARQQCLPFSSRRRRGFWRSQKSSDGHGTSTPIRTCIIAETDSESGRARQIKTAAAANGQRWQFHRVAVATDHHTSARARRGQASFPGLSPLFLTTRTGKPGKPVQNARKRDSFSHTGSCRRRSGEHKGLTEPEPSSRPSPLQPAVTPILADPGGQGPVPVPEKKEQQGRASFGQTAESLLAKQAAAGAAGRPAVVRGRRPAWRRRGHPSHQHRKI